MQQKKLTLIRQPLGDRVLDVFFYTIMGLLAVVCAYPIWYVLVASISDSAYVNSGALILLPRSIHYEGYKYILKDASLWQGYLNTIIYVVGGTVFGLAVTLPAGYALSRKDFPGRGIFTFYLVFTMYFSGGLIPTYLVVRSLGLINTRLVLILLGSVSVYNMILVRTFFSSTIPEELREAAFVDGCTNTRFFLQFVLPLSKAIIAVIGMYLAVGHWNSYYNAMIYCMDRKLQPLQLYLRQLLFTNVDIDTGLDQELMAKQAQIVSVIKYAVIVVATLPILCIYPFLQKYFVQGVMIGSLKG